MHPALDRENPMSLSRLIGNPKFDVALQNLETRHPEVFSMTERELKKHIRAVLVPVNADDSMLRMKFWFEYDAAMAEGRGMKLINICAGVLDEHFFWDYMMKPMKMAWIICPLLAYQHQLDEAVGSGMQKLRDILELDPVCPHTGKINTALIGAQTKIVAMLDMRKHGAYTQTINQRSVQLHATAQDVAKEIQSLSMEEVEKRMKRLDHMEKDALRIEARAKRPTYTVPSEVEE